MSQRDGLECAFLDGWYQGLRWKEQIDKGLIHDEDGDASHTRNGSPSVAKRAYTKWRAESKAVVERTEGTISSQAIRISELETELQKLKKDG